VSVYAIFETVQCTGTDNGFGKRVPSFGGAKPNTNRKTSRNANTNPNPKAKN